LLAWWVDNALGKTEDRAVIWLGEMYEWRSKKQGFKMALLWFLTGTALMQPSSRLELDLEICRSVIAQPHTMDPNQFERLLRNHVAGS